MNDSLPMVTVVMPIRNEAAFITRSLGSVLAQDYPPERLEVLVADGMSTDRTRSLVADLGRQHPKLRLIDNHGMIVPTGMNAALKHATGEIIVRVDGHTLIEPDYVRQCVKALSRTGADNVGGRMDAAAQGRVGEAVALATSSPFGVGGARFHYSDREEWVDTVYLGAWPREVFARIGIFDEEMVRNQDDELNYRLRAQGGRILLCPAIKSRYFNRSTLRSLWRQYFQYGYWKVRVLQKHPRQMRPRQFVPPLLVAALIAALLLAAFFSWGWLVLAFIGSSYLAANLAASLLTASQTSLRHFPLLPAVFLALHLSYGAGFLLGLIKFAPRWAASA
jgi:glycosyltransferase involved in cell wall biosynthesis